jgi:ribosome-associated toxin RatA of RatAB toxin-antitoxin module
MPRFEYSIDVDIPIRGAYDQWTRFEEYPSFMPTVKRVVQRDDKTFDMTSTVAGMRYNWTAEITDQTPDAGIAWKSTSGSGSEFATRVLLQPLGEDRTRVTMKAEVHPKGTDARLRPLGGAITGIEIPALGLRRTMFGAAWAALVEAKLEGQATQCGCAGGCAPSTRPDDARVGHIQTRTFTSTLGSYV